MREFINHLTERNYSNRKIAFIENGSWAPTATRVMKTMLEKSKNLVFAETDVKIMSALNEESRAQIDSLAKELA
jgi:flavorubredoxin